MPEAIALAAMILVVFRHTVVGAAIFLTQSIPLGLTIAKGYITGRSIAAAGFYVLVKFQPETMGVIGGLKRAAQTQYAPKACLMPK